MVNRRPAMVRRAHSYKTRDATENTQPSIAATGSSPRKNPLQSTTAVANRKAVPPQPAPESLQRGMRKVFAPATVNHWNGEASSKVSARDVGLDRTNEAPQVGEALTVTRAGVK